MGASLSKPTPELMIPNPMTIPKPILKRDHRQIIPLSKRFDEEDEEEQIEEYVSMIDQERIFANSENITRQDFINFMNNEKDKIKGGKKKYRKKKRTQKQKRRIKSKT